MNTMADKLHFDMTEDGDETDVFREVLRGNLGSLNKHSRTYTVLARNGQSRSSAKMEKELQVRIAKIRKSLVRD